MIWTLTSKSLTIIEKVFTKSAGKLSMVDLQHNLLHDIAFTIVLVKAYNILMEYAKHKHINIKYIIEIAIIAPIVEIIFNYASYSFPMIIFLGGLAILMAVLYLFFYDKIILIEENHQREKQYKHKEKIE